MKASLRGKCLAAFLLLIVMAWMLVFFWYALPLLQSLGPTLPATRILYQLKLVLLGLAGVALILAVTSIVFGLRVRHYQQYPPPNSWTWRDTLIQQGKAAKSYTWLLLGSGLLIALLSIGLALFASVAFRYVAPSKPSILSAPEKPGMRPSFPTVK